MVSLSQKGILIGESGVFDMFLTLFTFTIPMGKLTLLNNIDSKNNDGRTTVKLVQVDGK